MSGLLLAAAFAGGLGVLLLALGMLTSGMRLAGGNVLKANLARWAQTRFRAFETGFAIALCVPSSAASTRAAAGFVNSGLVRLENAIWLSVGVGFGSVVTAWLIVAAGLSANAFALGLGLIGLGAVLRSGLRGRRAAVGKALAGFGLLLLGVAILGDAFHRAAPGGLPAAPFGVLGSTVLFATLGACLATILRSASVAVAAAIVAVSSGAVQLSEAMAFVAGANLGPVFWATWVLVVGTAQARRVAASQIVFHSLGTLSGIALCLVAARFEAHLGGQGSAPIALAAYHLLFQCLGALLLVPAAGPLLRFVQHRFHRVEFERTASPRLDASLLDVPDLAVDSLLEEVRDLSEQARGLCHLAMRDRVVSDQRLRQDSEVLEHRVASLDLAIARLISGDVPADLALILVQLPRATSGLTRMLGELARFRALARINEQGLDARTRTRLRQLELTVLHLVEGADALDPAFDAMRCSQETETALQHLADVRRRVHEACGKNEIHPEWANPLCGRIDALERVALHACEIALCLDRALAPASDVLFDEPESTTVVRWLRRVA